MITDHWMMSFGCWRWQHQWWPTYSKTQVSPFRVCGFGFLAAAQIHHKWSRARWSMMSGHRIPTKSTRKQRFLVPLIEDRRQCRQPLLPRSKIQPNSRPASGWSWKLGQCSQDLLHFYLRPPCTSWADPGSAMQASCKFQASLHELLTKHKLDWAHQVSRWLRGSASA